MHEEMLSITTDHENANKTTVRYHLTSVKLGIIKNVGEDVKQRESCTLFMGLSVGTDSRTTVWRFHEKLKVEQFYGPAMPALGVQAEEVKSVSEWDTFTLMFIVHDNQDKETT